jgi:DNA polymerase-3 subunit alpha
VANLLYLDVETTGITAQKHDIIQLACIPIIDDNKFDSFNQFCQPLDYDVVEQGAIDVHGITIEKMRTFQSQAKLLDNFIKYLKTFNVKFTISGYNSSFDHRFIGAMFQKHGRNSDYRELFSNNIHDVMIRAKALKSAKKITSAKLTSVAEYLGVDLTNAHDALADIEATIEVDRKLAELMGENKLDKDSELALPTFDVQEVPALHLHSEFSVYDSATTASSWLHWASQNGVSGVAFPDHTYATSLYGSINPAKAKDGSPKYPTVTPVPAISLWITSLDAKPYMLSAWATSNKGYYNLVKLASIGWKTPIFIDKDIQAPSLTIDQVSEHKEDVVFGTACDKGLLSLLLDTYSDLSEIKINLRSITTMLGNLVLEYLPLDIHKLFDPVSGFTAYKTPNAVSFQNRAKAINNLIYTLVNEEGYNAIVSSISHFLEESDKIVQDCKMKNSFKDERYFWESRHQRSAKEQFATLSSHIKGFSLEDWNNAKVIAEDIVNKAKTIKIKHQYHLPKIPIPDNIKAKTDDYDKQLYYLTMSKIAEHGRWSDDPLYVARFKKEIDVIWKNKTMNFLPYFLVYEDIGSHARSQNILQGLARGSAGGCLLSYYLKITHIDPVARDLPFERFLSHARINAGSFPDIDSDFGIRHPILKYLKEKYDIGFAQIGTFQKMKIKSAIKHAMYALYGRSGTDFEIKLLCDQIPDSPQGLDEFKFIYGYVDTEEVQHKGIIETVPALQAFFSQYPDCEDLIKKLTGLPASVGRHPSAFVISTLDLSDGRAPTFITEDKDLGEIQVVQFDGPMCEKSGLVKADILGVTTIQTISDCIARVKNRHNIDLLEENSKGVASIYNLPEDPEVYKDFYNRKTDSSFQFNTDLIKGMIKDFAPQSVDDLAILTALARPGALDINVGRKAVVMVRYDDGSFEEYPEGEYDKWTLQLQNQR